MMDRGYLEEEAIRSAISLRRSNLKYMILFGLETAGECQVLCRLEHEILRVQARRGSKPPEEIVLHFMRDFE